MAMVGSIKDEILNLEELSLELLKYLHRDYPGLLKARYAIEESPEPLTMLEQIASNRKCIQKGGELDYGKAAGILLEEFRNGKIGRITLEKPLIQEQ